MTEEQPSRPRFGVLYRHNGERRTVVFYPHSEKPDTFVCHYAWAKGLAVLAGLAAIIVLTIAGINWAISL
jgi:hypothetical protein